MPSTLFVRPTRAYQLQETSFEWALYDIAGEQIKVGPPMSLEIIEQTLMQNGIDNVELVALWPAYTCYSAQISIPGNQARYIQQALPFAVEEQVAQDIEQIHMVLGPKLKGGEYHVINTDKSLFGEYFDLLQLEDSDLTLKSIFADADLIPQTGEDLTIILSKDQVLIRSIDHQVISTHEQNLIPYLDSVFIGQADSPAENTNCSIKVIVPPDRADDYQMICAQLDQYPNVDTVIEQTSLTEFELLCENYFVAKSSINSLCQGDFHISSASSGVWQKWKSVAVIASIGFALQLGIFIGQGYYYEQKAAAISQQALSAYKKIVPNSSKISVAKLPRVIKGKLNQREQSGVSISGFIELLGEAGFQFNKSKFKNQIKFKSLSFSDQRKELVIEMHAQSFDQLESLKNSIASAGFTAKISSAVQEKEYFRGRLSISDAS